jgi:sugar lactone lactonase YvrE
MKTNMYLRLLVMASLFTAVATQAQTYTFSILPGQTNANRHPLLNNPRGVAVDASGNVYVADNGNHVIRLFSTDGCVSTFSNLFSANDPQDPDDLSSFSFHSPTGIALDASGNIYVSDNNIIYKVTGTTSNAVVTIVAGSTQGNQDGIGNSAKFNNVNGLAVDTFGNIWVADQNNGEFREVTSNDVVITVAPLQINTSNVPGKQQDDGRFSGVVIDGQNNIFLMDDHDYIHEYSSSGSFSTLWSGGNSSSSSGLGVDNDDNVYMFDGGSNAVLRISSSGMASVLGTLPTTHPQVAGVALDAFRNIYMVDQHNNLVIKGVVSYPPFFNGQVALGNGVYYLAFTNGIPFGYYNLGDFDFPWFYHYDMGFEYFFDANDGNGGCYLYDSTSGDFWYTSPGVFPYLYDFTLNSWLYYFPDPNDAQHYTSNPRYFYDYGTGQIITK